MGWISAVGLYSWDSTLFDGMALPEGVERETLIYNILAETAELEILYPDSDFLKRMIEIWSKKELKRWTALYNTTVYEYNPIENFDKIETWSDTGSAVSRVAGFNESELVTAGDGNTESRHEGRTRGNVGTTTTQQMIREEREVSEFNIYDVIVQDFKKRFCLMVY